MPSQKRERWKLRVHGPCVGLHGLDCSSSYRNTIATLHSKRCAQPSYQYLQSQSVRMGVPFEALIPYGIILGVRLPNALSIQQALTNVSIDVRILRCCPFENQSHAKRWKESETFSRSMGQTKYVRPNTEGQAAGDREEPLALLYTMGRRLTDIPIAVMNRDLRLTGFLRGQTDRVEAPPGFELSNPWRVWIRRHMR